MTIIAEDIYNARFGINGYFLTIFDTLYERILVYRATHANYKLNIAYLLLMVKN